MQNKIKLDTLLEQSIKEIKYMYKINAIVIFLLFLVLVFVFNILKIDPVIKYITLIGFVIYICIMLRLLKTSCLKAELIKVRNDFRNICDRDNNFITIGVYAITMEIGNDLIKLADLAKDNDENDNGRLLSKIAVKRKEICNKLGYNFPNIRVMDNQEIEPNKCRIFVRNNLKLEFNVHPDYIAIENYNGNENIVLTKENYIIFDSPVSIIKKEDLPDKHEYKTYSAVEIIISHIGYLTVRYADEILTNEDIKQLIESIETKEQKELLLKDLNKDILRNVYTNLIKENLCLLDIIKFFELYNEYKQEDYNADYISEKIRNNNNFRTQITNKYQENSVIKTYSISERTEELILNAKTYQQEKEIISLLLNKIHPNSENLIICSKDIRLKLYRIINEVFTRTNIIAYSEILKNVELEIIDKL